MPFARTYSTVPGPSQIDQVDIPQNPHQTTPPTSSPWSCPDKNSSDPDCANTCRSMFPGDCSAAKYSTLVLCTLWAATKNKRREQTYGSAQPGMKSATVRVPTKKQIHKKRDETKHGLFRPICQGITLCYLASHLLSLICVLRPGVTE